LCETVNFFEMAEGRIQSCAFVETVMKIWFPLNQRISWPDE